VKEFALEFLSWDSLSATLSFRDTRPRNIDGIIADLTRLLGSDPKLDLIEVSPSGRKARIEGPDVPRIAKKILVDPPFPPPDGWGILDVRITLDGPKAPVPNPFPRLAIATSSSSAAPLEKFLKNKEPPPSEV
jgi:hypothetical protein